MASRSPSEIDSRLRATFEYARLTTERAKARAETATQRSAVIRDAVARMRSAGPAAWDAGQRAVALLHLAAEESARSVHERDRFLAVVGHELRQPLTAALAAIEVLEVSRTENERARARAVLRRQMNHMARLVDDLRDLSRHALELSELKTATLDLRRVIELVLELMTSSIAAGRLTLETALPPDPLWIHGDESRLVQVFTNLVGNAVRYTAPGGRVTIAARPEHDRIVAEVGDTGRGIDSRDLPQVFEPFARGNAPGSDGFGIGLALARGIVERHGGSVDASSDGPGCGSRFTVVLPAAPPP